MNQGEFSAIGDMLTAAQWELPSAEEYKNDLTLPAFLSLENNQSALTSFGKGMPPMLALGNSSQPFRPDPAGPAAEQQWEKLKKIVAWLQLGL